MVNIEFSAMKRFCYLLCFMFQRQLQSDSVFEKIFIVEDKSNLDWSMYFPHRRSQSRNQQMTNYRHRFESFDDAVSRIIKFQLNQNFTLRTYFDVKFHFQKQSRSRSSHQDYGHSRSTEVTNVYGEFFFCKMTNRTF